MILPSAFTLVLAAAPGHLLWLLSVLWLLAARRAVAGIGDAVHPIQSGARLTRMPGALPAVGPALLEGDIHAFFQAVEKRPWAGTAGR
jgi:hypothetical protein